MTALRHATAFMAGIVLLLSAAAVYARGEEPPLIGIAAINANSPRTAVLTTFLEDGLTRAVDTVGWFRTTNPVLMREQLKKFGCTGERCLLGFARDAGLRVMVRADLDDADDFIILSLRAYGIDLPYQYQIIYRYTVRIPMTGKYGPAEYNNIMEEHTRIFFSRFLSRYQDPLYLEMGPDGPLRVIKNISGTFALYRPEQATGVTVRTFRKIGDIRIKNGTVEGTGPPAKAGDFVLIDFRDSARLLDNAAYEGKKETVFRKSSFTDTLIILLLTGPLSATMPIIAPLAGYYPAGDWTGLSLWTLSTAPYLYLEINGLTEYWKNYYKKKKTVPREVRAQYYFGLYTLCAGGASLAADAIAHKYIENAALFQGVQPYMGSAVTAGYLSLVAGGAGHFYRGNRLWGYLYYHASNLLLYFTLREFLPDKKFMPLTQRFSTGRINTLRAYTLLSAACAVKLADVIHAVLSRDNIRGGEIIEEGYAVEPALFAGEGSDVGMGLQFSYRW